MTPRLRSVLSAENGVDLAPSAGHQPKTARRATTTLVGRVASARHSSAGVPGARCATAGRPPKRLAAVANMMFAFPTAGPRQGKWAPQAIPQTANPGRPGRCSGLVLSSRLYLGVQGARVRLCGLF